MTDRDEKFDEFLRRAAGDYNAPHGDVPRDEMWTAIVSARRGAGDAGRSSGGGAVGRRPPSLILRRAAWIGMAATLVVGVAIGRFALRPAGTPHELAGAPKGVVSAESGPGATPSIRGAIVAPSPLDSGNGSSHPGDYPTDLGYLVATTEHLARAEALLTAYGASPADGAVDAQLTQWAQDVLANTRLLLDSPAGRDPQRRRLMEDLEMVLVQLVQRPSGARAIEERSHINRSLERTQVLPRLRSTQAQGLTSGI